MPTGVGVRDGGLLQRSEMAESGMLVKRGTGARTRPCPTRSSPHPLLRSECSPMLSAIRCTTCLPGTVGVVWLRQHSFGWGTGPKKFTEQFAYLMPFEKHVTLGSYLGGELPDPERPLPDSGRRQVKAP